MPKIPLPQVALQTGSTPDFAAPSLGVQMPDIAGRQISALGQSLTEFGSGISSVAHVVQDKVDRAARLIQNQVDDSRTKSAFTKFSELTTQEMLNPKTGFLTQIGGNANQEALESTLERINKNGAGIAKSLDNDMQRSMYKEAVDRHMIGIQQQGWAHLADQTQKEAIGQADAYLKQVTSNAANAHLYGLTSYEDKIVAAGAEQYATGQTEWLKDYVTIPQEPNNAKSKQTNSEYDRQVNTLRTAADDLANLKGWSKQDPRRKELLLETSTNMNSQIFDNYIGNGRNAAAAKFVATLSLKDVDSSTLSKMQSMVKRVTDLDNGVRIAMSVMDLVNNKPKPTPTPQPSWKPGGGLSADSSEVSLDSPVMPEQADVPPEDKFGGNWQQQAVGGINQLYKSGKINYEERGSALHEIDSVHQRMKNVFTDNQAEALKQAENLLIANHDLRISSSQFPPQLYDQLSRYGILDDAAKFEGGLPIVTTQENYVLVMKAIDDGSLAKMSNQEVYTRFGAKLSKLDFKDLQISHERITGGKGKSTNLAEELAGLTASEEIKAIALKYNLITDGNKEADKRIMAVFSLALLQRLRKSEANGVKLTPEFRDKQALDIIANRSFTDHWYSPKTLFIEGDVVPPGETVYKINSQNKEYESKTLSAYQQGLFKKFEIFVAEKGIEMSSPDKEYFVQELDGNSLDSLIDLTKDRLNGADYKNNSAESVNLLFTVLRVIKEKSRSKGSKPPPPPPPNANPYPPH